MFVLLACSLVIPSVALGQTSDQKLMSSLSAIFMDYDGPMTSEYLNYENFSPGVSLGTHFYLNAPLNLSINTAFVPKVNYPGTGPREASPSLIDANALVQFKLNNGRILRERAFLAPYFSTGMGINSIRSQVGLYIPVALGMRFRITKGLSFNIESMYKQSLGSGFQHLAHTAGIVFSMPQQKKQTTPMEDDRRAIPAPMLTSKEPVMRPRMSDDADGDGITDAEDQCPNMMGLIQYAGCPQKIAEPADGASMAMQSMQEAPDFQEEPMEFELSEDNELTLTDRAAPQKPLEIDQEDLDYLSFAVQNIYFETNEDKLKDESLPILDKVAEILEKYPTAFLKVSGHTDNVGDSKNNLVLSIKRAFRVKYYLVHQKGIKLARIDSNGMGDAQPIANNTSDDGRKLNRRVEFELAQTL